MIDESSTIQDGSILRARDLDLDFDGTPGPYNALTDVPGVEVGMRTMISGHGALVPGQGPVRTGVTAICPRGQDPVPRPVWAGQYTLNGNGEMTGAHWIHDGGYLVGPICITNTHSVGMVHHAAVQWMLETYRETFREQHLWAMPVVAETYDGVLNDINGQHVTAADARLAIDAARSGPISEGNVGGGTGMICYEFKGGTGTASRLLEVDGESFTVGALVQANHGIRPWLSVLGVPVGRYLTEDTIHNRETGSIIAIIGTDIPMLPHQLQRLARRGAIGVGRSGSPGGNDSGDIFLAFSVANATTLPHMSDSRQSLDYINDEAFDAIYLAAVEAIEEAVINTLVAAEDMPILKPYGGICRAIDHERLVDVMRRHGRCG